MRSWLAEPTLVNERVLTVDTMHAQRASYADVIHRTSLIPRDLL